MDVLPRADLAVRDLVEVLDFVEGEQGERVDFQHTCNLPQAVEIDVGLPIFDAVVVSLADAYLVSQMLLGEVLEFPQLPDFGAYVHSPWF